MVLYNNVFVLLIVVVSQLLSDSLASKTGNQYKTETTRWTYQCVEGYCQKQLHHDELPDISLETCNMMCSYPQLWPAPKSLKTVNPTAVSFSVSNIIFFNVSNDTILQKATKIFRRNVKSLQYSKTNSSKTRQILLNVYFHCGDCENTQLSLETDESYELRVEKIENNTSVNLTAQNFFGIRHGLETLSQLIWWDTKENTLKVLTNVYIQDKPEFPYRGLMVDTARNFFNVHHLRKVINGMAASKLNVLHLHLSDTQSFPIELPSNPHLAAFGAYSSEMTYTATDIENLRQFALLRGIRLVLEVDAPGHINSGWKMQNSSLTMCDKNPMNEGQLNPDNDQALTILEEIYEDLIKLAGQNEIFHIGGDEVNADCWRNTYAASGHNDMKLFQVEYMNKMIQKLKEANKNSNPKHIVLWSSAITDVPYYLNSLAPKENIAVQFWFGQMNSILNSGHKVIYSTVGHWYLDCGLGPWHSRQKVGTCNPFTSWREFYKYRPWRDYGNVENTLGGEVCLWTELTDEDELETRIWPRTSAFAERVWSDKSVFDKNVYVRLSSHREVLKSRGLKVSAIWPQWCAQNPGVC